MREIKVHCRAVFASALMSERTGPHTHAAQHVDGRIVAGAAQTRRALNVSVQQEAGVERALLTALLDGHGARRGLRRIDGVDVLWDYHDLRKRDLIVGIAFANLKPTDAVREYEKRGVIVYERVASSLYSGRMLKSFNLDGAVRISPLHCHSPRDVERFLAITEELAAI
jgi:selenocysteine lyase/cysteine desulfurase